MIGGPFGVLARAVKPMATTQENQMEQESKQEELPIWLPNVINAPAGRKNNTSDSSEGTSSDTSNTNTDDRTSKEQGLKDSTNSFGHAGHSIGE